ncbi:MAG: acetyl-CoA carboxylase biotin carboxyl carrier protein [Mariprofundales bacterium]
MDVSDIRKLVRLVEQSDIQELKIKDGKFSIYIARNIKTAVTEVSPMSIMQPIMPQEQLANIAPVAHNDNKEASVDNAENVENNAVDEAHIVKSQMVGTFYSSSSPEVEPFVSKGSSIQQGDSLCIIEAMKMMNEIPAEYSGVVEKIMVENASPVEYGQPLFVIRPN